MSKHSKSRPPMARRVYYGPDKMRAAWLAGNGHSLSDIAAAMGGTTRLRVHAMLAKCGLGTLPKRPNEIAMTIVTTRPKHALYTAIAVSRDTDPEALVARILSILADEQVLLNNLLDDHDDEGSVQ